MGNVLTFYSLLVSVIIEGSDCGQLYSGNALSIVKYKGVIANATMVLPNKLSQVTLIGL